MKRIRIAYNIWLWVFVVLAFLYTSCFSVTFLLPDMSGFGTHSYQPTTADYLLKAAFVPVGDRNHIPLVYLSLIFSAGWHSLLITLVLFKRGPIFVDKQRGFPVVRTDRNETDK
jgi:hypothetical protein